MKICGQRRLEGYLVTLYRMGEAEARRMQRLSSKGRKRSHHRGTRSGRQAPPPAVERIADNGMSDVCEVHADLVRTPRFELHAQQRVHRKTTLETVMSHRVPTVFAHGHARTLRAMSPDGFVDRTAARHRALAEREIFAVHVARSEQAHELRLRERRARHDQQA